jgi:ubiquinone biosynthesis protein
MRILQIQNVWDIDISSLVPEQYAAYRPLVVDALLFFVQHLSAVRAAMIFAEQQSLSHNATIAQRLAALLRHCPTLHKLGQMVARDRRLDPELRHRLQELESMEPTRSMSLMTRIVKHELKDFPVSTLRIKSKALAEASVAIVIPFAFDAPKATAVTEGVFKVLKPGIEEYLDEELEIWCQLSSYIDERCEHYGLPALRYADTLETIRELLASEIRLDREQHHLAEAAAFYAESESVRIPKLLPFCTPRITAMERITGRKVTETEDLSDTARNRLADSIIEALISRPLWTPGESSLFHADPHAGNLFFTEDEHLAILDWSLVGRLRKTERVQTMQIMLGALSLDSNRIVLAIMELAQSRAKESALRRVVDKALSVLYEGRSPGFKWLLNLLDDATLSAGVRFSEDLLFFRKSVLTIEGVIADVSRASSFERVLPLSALIQFARESMSRSVSLPTSRAFGTHVSNLDLLSLYLAIPSATMKYWNHLLDKWLSDMQKGQ